MGEEELRILIVEDAPADAELCQRELQRAGLKFTSQLVDTRDAFERALEAFDPNLVLSDFSMPTSFDGLTALDLTRAKSREIPFVFVSGTIGEDRAVEAMKRGATDYVLKDRMSRLVPVILRALEEARERTARRRAEEEIQRQRAFLRQVIDLDRSRIFAKDRDGRYTLVNQATAEAYRASVEGMLGKTTAEFHPDRELTERMRKSDLEVLDNLREVFIPEQLVRDLDGTERWFQVTKRPLVSAEGRADMVLAVATEITERKLQELKIVRLSRVQAVLSGINSAIVRIRDRQKLFEEACRIAVEHGGFGIAWIGTLDPETQELVPLACAGIEADSFLAHSRNTARSDSAWGGGVAGRAVREKRAVYSNDLLNEASHGGARRKEAIRRGYRSVVVLPLIVEGSVVGTMSLFAKEPNYFDDEEMKLLNELADDISFSLEHMAKEQKIEKLSRIRAVSSRINAAIVRIRERQALFEETCRIVSDEGKFEMVWIGAIDTERQQVSSAAWRGFSEETAKAVSWSSIGSSQGTLGEAVRSRKPAVRNDIETQLPGGKLRQEALDRGCLSTVCLPLVVDDRVAALITLFAAGRGFFDQDELALLEEVAADVSFALDHIAKEERLAYLAYYDALTGLPNRTLFQDRLEQRVSAARRDQKIFSVIMLDIERFRNINETLGRQAGDGLLREFTKRLQNVLEETDVVAHMGGDYFTIATRRAEAAADIVRVLEQILGGVSGQPYQVGGSELRLAVRAGVAVYPGDGADADGLLRNAEAALKDAKRTGHRYLFYAPQMNAKVAEQLKLENDLRRAVLEEQFVLHYQPRVDIVSGNLTGLEALIRWMHPERGLIAPGEFIPILESTGLILEAGRWALKRAATDHAQWRAAGLKAPRVAVNVSAIQLRRQDFVEDVVTALAGADGFQYLDIEITESMLMEDIDGNIEKLQAIQAIGMQVAMDDFGTGYCSLSYLAKLPINSLKIDRSFISQMTKSAEQMAIVSTIVSLARALNLKVVAEGVETQEQASLLRLLRCDEAQGFLYARPEPNEKVRGRMT